MASLIFATYLQYATSSSEDFHFQETEMPIAPLKGKLAFITCLNLAKRTLPSKLTLTAQKLPSSKRDKSSVTSMSDLAYRPLIQNESSCKSMPLRYGEIARFGG